MAAKPADSAARSAFSSAAEPAPGPPRLDPFPEATAFRMVSEATLSKFMLALWAASCASSASRSLNCHSWAAARALASAA